MGPSLHDLKLEFQKLITKIMILERLMISARKVMNTEVS
jgi:hypothetical protein